MTDAELNAFIAAFGDDERFRRTVERRGDTAYQSRLIAPIIAATARWSLVRPVSAVLLKAVRYGLRGLWDGGAHTAPEEPDEG
jgi:hypothetical protein